MNTQILSPLSSISPDCVVCNSHYPKVRARDLKRSYVPAITYAVLVLAPLIGLILLLALRVEHDLTLQFCEKCWNGKKLVSKLQGLGGLLALASLPAGFAVMLQFDSGWAFFPLPVICIAAILVLEAFKSRYQPKYKLVDKHRVVVHTREGDLEFAKTTNATLHPA